MYTEYILIDKIYMNIRYFAMNVFLPINILTCKVSLFLNIQSVL